MKYIYNMRQSDYFVKRGCKVIGTGYGAKGDPYVLFEDNETFDMAYVEWQTHNKVFTKTVK